MAIPPFACGRVFRGRGADGWNRTITATRRRVYSAGSSPMLSVRVRGDRPGSNRRCGTHNPGCFRLHHGHHESGDDRTRTGGLSPDKRALCSSELRPHGRAGGIRTHGLELMRLARTAAPLPRKSGWQESNLRSPASGAGGVASLPYSQSKPPAGVEPAASGLRARRHSLSTTGAKAPAAGLEPAFRD